MVVLMMSSTKPGGSRADIFVQTVPVGRFGRGVRVEVAGYRMQDAPGLKVHRYGLKVARSFTDALFVSRCSDISQGNAGLLYHPSTSPHI